MNPEEEMKKLDQDWDELMKEYREEKEKYNKCFEKELEKLDEYEKNFDKRETEFRRSLNKLKADCKNPTIRRDDYKKLITKFDEIDELNEEYKEHSKEWEIQQQKFARLNERLVEKFKTLNRRMRSKKIEFREKSRELTSMIINQKQ